jgi:hypothetical protein
MFQQMDDIKLELVEKNELFDSVKEKSNVQPKEKNDESIESE